MDAEEAEEEGDNAVEEDKDEDDDDEEDDANEEPPEEPETVVTGDGLTKDELAVLESVLTEPLEALSPEATASSSSMMGNYTFYGWDAEQENAFRVTADGRQTDLAVTLKKPKDASPNDGMIAVFGDGTEHVLNDLTVEEYDIYEDSKAKRSADTQTRAPPIWEGMRDDKKIRLRTTPIKKVLFLVLKEGDAQLCQLRFDLLGEDGSVSTSIMTEIAKRYTNKEIERVAIKEEKDKLIAVEKRCPKQQPRNMQPRRLARPLMPLSYHQRSRNVNALRRPVHGAPSRRSQTSRCSIREWMTDSNSDNNHGKTKR